MLSFMIYAPFKNIFKTSVETLPSCFATIAYCDLMHSYTFYENSCTSIWYRLFSTSTSRKVSIKC